MGVIHHTLMESMWQIFLRELLSKGEDEDSERLVGELRKIWGPQEELISMPSRNALVGIGAK